LAAVAPTEHYFAVEPCSSSAPRSIELLLPDLQIRLATDRGVFSPDHIDPGTKLLLLDAPPAPADGCPILVDLGCGYGAVALTLATRRPQATVWAVDVNRRALDLCRANASAAGLRNVTTVSPDEVPEDLGVDAIYSNPPIRVGKAALHDLLTSWIVRLRPGGTMLLVVHKHLGADSLQRWLAAEAGPTQRLVSRSGYRLLETVRPSS
jgi:16S rRNA (guanine1207-N2)-methyltransferase